MNDFKENLICGDNYNDEKDNNNINNYNIFRNDLKEKLIDSKNLIPNIL